MLKGAIVATSATYSDKVRSVRTKSGTSRGSSLATSKTGGGYRELFAASSQARIAMIRQGVPAIEAKRLVQALGVEQKVFYQALGLKTATVNRKITQSEQLASDESERLLGVARLIGQVEAIVAESGDPKGFDAPEWLSRWLQEPLPALGGTPPMALLDTMEGQAMVAEALSRIQSGAYA
jgi:putative toxin-antitoxin system antitoxin component (TIGR02293 family)